MVHGLRTLAALLIVAIVGSVSGAPATKSPAAEKPKTLPIVTIKKSDGSTVHGQLARSDGEHLTINPTEEKGFGAPIEVSWSDVKTVSNGLTRQKAQDAWKAEHKSELCDACHGDRRVDCEVCKGTGHDPASSKDCKTCKGAGVVACTDPKCDNGKIPCPGPCLKLTEGTWTKPDATGKRWRTLSGGWRFSSGHIGQVIKFGKRGEQPEVTDCTICGRTGSITCPTCGGDDKVACPTCKANKSAADCTACEDGKVPCKTCGGSGLKTGATLTAEASPERQEDAPKPAAEPPAPPTFLDDNKPDPPPVVVVKKNDGTSVQGQLTASDGEHLTIQPADAKGAGKPIEVAWSDVKSVSNGLTRQLALLTWKGQHRAELCETCHGDRRVECERCKGTGHDPASSKECKTCHGELLVDCPDKNCKDGKIPCPGPCLKLSEGNWVKSEADGKLWRTFPMKDGGSFRFSQGHVGEVVIMPKDLPGRPHQSARTVPCEICGKTGFITCPTCGGDHKVACPTCKADKSAADCASCEGGTVACKTCGGTGLKGGTASPAPATPAKPAKRAVNDSDGF